MHALERVFEPVGFRIPYTVACPVTQDNSRPRSREDQLGSLLVRPCAYAEQVQSRLEKQLQRRAQEWGYELKKIEPPHETLVRPDAEVLTLTAEGDIVYA